MRRHKKHPRPDRSKTANEVAFFSIPGEMHVIARLFLLDMTGETVKRSFRDDAAAGFCLHGFV